MLIAIDYDGTYTKDPDLWMRFIDDSIRSGHEVICASMRHESEPIDNQLSEKVRVIYTSRKAKVKALIDININPDIWIDDSPYWLFTDG